MECLEIHYRFEPIYLYSYNIHNLHQRTGVGYKNQILQKRYTYYYINGELEASSNRIFVAYFKNVQTLQFVSYHISSLAQFTKSFSLLNELL